MVALDQLAEPARQLVGRRRRAAVLHVEVVEQSCRVGAALAARTCGDVLDHAHHSVVAGDRGRDLPTGGSRGSAPRTTSVLAILTLMTFERSADRAEIHPRRDGTRAGRHASSGRERHAGRPAAAHRRHPFDRSAAALAHGVRLPHRGPPVAAGPAVRAATRLLRAGLRGGARTPVRGRSTESTTSAPSAGPWCSTDRGSPGSSTARSTGSTAASMPRPTRRSPGGCSSLSPGTRSSATR